MEFDGIGLRNPPADIFNPMVKKGRFDPEFPIIFDKTSMCHRMFHDADIFLIDAARAKTVEILFPACRIIAMDRMGHFIQVEAHQHRAEAKTMVPMEMADEDPSDARGRDIGEDKLPLGPFAWIEEEPLVIPS